ncbi:RHS repeat-associated core domain-containing protein [Pseudomonas sp. LB3P14]
MNGNLHWRTPSVSVTNPQGLHIRQIEYLRKVAGGEVQTLITRQQHDVSGRPVAQRDPRLPTPNTTTVHNLNGQALNTHSVDAGMSTILPGLARQIVQTWDAHGNHRSMSYDNQLRMTAIKENTVPDVETFTYATATADPAHNLRGQMTEFKDPSGTVDFHSFGLAGAALRETRTFHDAKAFVSQRTFSPLGTVLEQIDAGEHTQQSMYDVAGQLQQVNLQLKDETEWQTVLQHAQYNAAGQIIEQLSGNGVTSRWLYHPADGRLHRQTAQKDPASVIQDLEYQYDRVGNIIAILDHAFTPTFFANQRVDGHRAFTYDSLYQLHSATGPADAPPSDIPGRPQPTDPNDRRNYTEFYEYDRGGNLVKTTHVRDGANHTREMAIAPTNNRGVRWKPGDPPPDFGTLFDRAGNQLTLQPGQSMQWNSRGQLEKVTLVDRNGNGANDDEYYRYSQGERVYKRHETHTTKVSHFHEVHYLPGLEIRNKDTGEELHVITLAIGIGSVICLHWVTGKPAGIDADQLRYTLKDHLGSAVKELDGQAQLISEETYLPFGGTASLTARSAVEVDYKTLRYSGKETDVTGSIYYGARYYAPWLGRWISADPAGDVDGLNRYAFVGNNPMGYVDPTGGARAESVIMLYSGFVSQVGGHAEQLLGQLHNIIQQKGIVKSLATNLAGETVRGIAGYEGGVIGGGQFDLAVPNAPFTTPYTTPGGLVGGNIGGDVAGAMADPPLNSIGLSVGPLIPQTSKMSVSAIDSDLGITDAVKEIGNWSDFKDQSMHPALDSVLNPDFMMNRVMASWISIIPATINMFARAIEGEDIKNRLDPVKIGKIETMLSDWQTALEERSAWAENAFNALGKEVLYPGDVLPNVNGTTPKEVLAPISRSGLRQQTSAALYDIAHAQRGLAAYKEMGTTDNQYLRRQAHPTKPHSSNWWTKSA